MGGVLVVEVAAPGGFRVSELLGVFHGRADAAKLDQERDAQEETARRIAKAQAEAQARAAMEVENFRQQQAAILSSLEMKQTAANVADGICYSAPLALFFWGNDAAAYARTAQDACKVAGQLRREIVEAQAEAARIGSAIMQRTAPVVQARK